MALNKDQLVQIIEAVVRKEVRKAMVEVAPKIVKEVMAGLIMEQTVSEEATQFRGNSDKRRRMMEQDEPRRRPAPLYEDDADQYETEAPQAVRRQTRRPMVEWDGDDMPQIGGRRARQEQLIIPDKKITENGAVPVDPNEVPDFIINALNRDYRSMMKDLPSVRSSNG